MKDQIKPIDVSILSTYMGRSLTIVVTAVVVGIAASAYLTGGGPGGGTVTVCVPAGSPAAGEGGRYDPFRVLLGRETGRPVELIVCDGDWPAGCDLYIMSMHAYLRYGEPLGLSVLCEVVPGGGAQDGAVLVARPADAGIDFARLPPGEIAFTSPSSVNGFWVQLSSLVQRGFNPPADGRGLRFEGANGGGSRVLLGVVHGAYRLGACRLTDLSSMAERGVVRPGELEIVQRDPALPELVVAAPEQAADYYRRKLRNIDNLLETSAGSVSSNANVELLKAYGVGRLLPAEPARLERTRQLFQKYGKLF